MYEDEAISLSLLNSRIKNNIREEFSKLIWVTAEINQLNQHSSGHCYLELVDKNPHTDSINASIRATIWASSFHKISAFFKTSTSQSLTSGIKVLLKVQVDFHEVYGISLNVRDIDPNYTLGDMARKRAEVIRKLDEAGIADMNKELSLARVAQTIAVISSPSAAGYEDFCEQLANNPAGYSFKWKLFPAKMQGEQTAQSIIEALDRIAEYQDLFDLVVIIRGGGSKTDLSFFDDFDLAYYVTQFPLPIIAGIGHDRDESVVDLVAHTSCKTPTAVAEFLIDLAEQFDSELDWLKESISREARKTINEYQSLLLHHSKSLKQSIKFYQEDKKSQLKELALLTNSISKGYINQLRRPVQNIESGITRYLKMYFLNKTSAQSELFKRTHTMMSRSLSTEKHKIALIEKEVQYLDPFTILQRGYSISYKDGKPIKDITVLKSGDQIETRVDTGTFKSTIVKSKSHDSKK